MNYSTEKLRGSGATAREEWAADEIDRLRAANARLQAWHDAVRSDPWWYDEHGNEIMFRPQPLAKE